MTLNARCPSDVELCFLLGRRFNRGIVSRRILIAKGQRIEMCSYIILRLHGGGMDAPQGRGAEEHNRGEEERSDEPGHYVLHRHVLLLGIHHGLLVVTGS